MTSTELLEAATLRPTVIERRKGWSSLGLRELWEYRELVYSHGSARNSGRYTGKQHWEFHGCS